MNRHIHVLRGIAEAPDNLERAGTEAQTLQERLVSVFEDFRLLAAFDPGIICRQVTAGGDVLKNDAPAHVKILRAPAPNFNAKLFTDSPGWRSLLRALP
jgi:hypothetical protein